MENSPPGIHAMPAGVLIVVALTLASVGRNVSKAAKLVSASANAVVVNHHPMAAENTALSTQTEKFFSCVDNNLAGDASDAKDFQRVAVRQWWRDHHAQFFRAEGIGRLHAPSRFFFRRS